MRLTFGSCFLMPGLLARHLYPERYAEPFWRIPGGTSGAWICSGISVIGTTVGIYYTIALPWSPDIPTSVWVRNVSAICVVTLVAGVLIYYVFGKRAATKLSDDERLAHLTTLAAPTDPSTTPTTDRT